MAHPNTSHRYVSCFAPANTQEVLLGKGYNQQVDIWSCGVIVFALLSGYTPFYSTDVQTLFQKIVNIDYEFNPDYWSQQSEMAKDFIRKCLCDKSKRMTAAEALQHPWIEGLMVSDGRQNRGSKLKRMLDPTEPMNSNYQEDTLVSQVDRMEHLQNLRRKYGTTSEAHMERLDHFLKDFKEELSDHSCETSQPKDKGKSKENSNKVDLELHSSEGPPGTLDEHRPSGETNGTKLSYTRHYIREASSGSRAQKETKTAEVLNELLEHYRTAKRPSFSRVDPTVQTRPNSSSTLERAIKMVPTLLNQSLSIGSIIASHAIYGPPKKSWGVEMSILTKTIREVSKHSDLTTIPVLQKIFDLARFLPVPEDGLVTPVTFRVKRRGLRGVLAESDAKETGKRELTGEWIVGKQTWRRLQGEWQNGKRSGKERVILYIHGGAYFVMSAITHRPLTIALSKYCECRVFCVNYRLAPDTIFPGALLDCVAAWFRLIDDLHIPANNVVLAADSAGGGLAIALLMYLRDNKYPLPGGAILFSPWVDLTLSCDSWETNKEFDYLPRPNDGDHMHPVAAYLGPNFDKYLTHPYVSPLFGDMHGLPPLLIQTGDAEVLRDENILFAHKCSLAGVPVRHEIYEDCVHVFQFFLFLDASRKALQSTRHFMRTALDKRPKRQASKVTADAREQLDNEMSGGMNNAQGQRVEPATGAPKGEAQAPAEENGEQMVTIKDVEPSDDESQDWALDSNGNSDNEKEDQEPMDQDPPSLSTSQSTEGQQSEEKNIKYKDNMQAENTKEKIKNLHVQSSQSEKANDRIKNGKANSG